MLVGAEDLGAMELPAVYNPRACRDTFASTILRPRTLCTSRHGIRAKAPELWIISSVPNDRILFGFSGLDRESCRRFSVDNDADDANDDNVSHRYRTVKNAREILLTTTMTRISMIITTTTTTTRTDCR